MSLHHLRPRRLAAILATLILLLALGGCSLPGQQSDAEESSGLNPTRTTARATARPKATRTPNFSRPDGELKDRPGPTATPLGDDEIPPSLIIEELVPFTHEGTGISGLRPRNWKLFAGDDSFQISSSPTAPDGFIGALLTAEKLPKGSQEEQIAMVMERMIAGEGDGEPPEVLEQTTEEDGSATLLANISGNAQGSTKVFKFVLYMRLTPTPKGILMSMVQVPAELYPEEAELVKEMVDSLRLEE
jgi:hypothetical protein